MTNEEAIAELRHWMKSDCYIDAPSNEACEFAITALERDRWISVEERLPEKWEPVYAAVRSEGREDWVIEVEVYDPYLTCPWGYIPMIENGKAEVYAWMPRPRPEPPKEET